MPWSALKSLQRFFTAENGFLMHFMEVGEIIGGLLGAQNQAQGIVRAAFVRFFFKFKQQYVDHNFKYFHRLLVSA